jgi:hypothetical protein
MFRSSTISRLAGAAAAIWLCCALPAWAGSGASGITLQGVVDTMCMAFVPGATGTPPWCPQLPAVTQQVIEIAGLTNQSPDAVRTTDNVCNSGNGLFGPTAAPPYCPQVAINAVNGPAKSPTDDSNDDSSHDSGGASSSAFPFLTPLNFTPGVVPTQVGDPAAVASFAAVVLEDEDGQPQTLDVFVETNKPGPVTLSFPLVVLNKDGSETPVAATLKASCNGHGPCSATVSGVGPGKTSYSPGQLGLYFSFNSGLVELRIPLVVTMQNDPAYFTKVELANPAMFTTSPCPIGVNPTSAYCEAFSKQDLGSPAGFLGKGASIGIAPYPAPLCTTGANTNCPTTPPATPPTTYFGFCASFSNKQAIAAFVGVGTDATTYVSSPVPGTGITLPQCPPQN